jgi:hypothetical protein
MKTLEGLIVAGVSGWVLWIVFSTIFLTHASGSTEWGGFPVADRAELHDYLAQRGFTSVSVTNHSDIAVERFRGNYQGSRPFFVTVSTQTTNRLGICVGTDYHYSGFVRSVDASSDKAQEFSKALNHWLEEHRTRKLNAPS